MSRRIQSRAGSRKVGVPQPDALRNFLDGPARPVFGMASTADPRFAASLQMGGTRPGRVSGYCAPLRSVEDLLRPKLYAETEDNPSLDIPGVHSKAPSSLYPEVAERVNSIRAGEAPGYWVEAPGTLEGDQVWVMRPERFERGEVRPPQLTKVVPPDGGYMNQQPLTDPKAREDALRILAQNQMARSHLEKETHKKMRCVAQMQKHQPHGIVGVEAPGTEGTIVYKTHRDKLIKAQTRAQHLMHKRKEEAKARSSETLLGYSIVGTVDPNAELPPGQPGEVKLMPRRHKNAHHDDSYKRLFGLGLAFGERLSGEPKETFVYRPPNAARAQEVRNTDSNGRAFNIITGAQTEHILPSIEEKVNSRQNHPSLNNGQVPPHVDPTRSKANRMRPFTRS